VKKKKSGRKRGKEKRKKKKEKGKGLCAKESEEELLVVEGDVLLETVCHVLLCDALVLLSNKSQLLTLAEGEDEVEEMLLRAGTRDGVVDGPSKDLIAGHDEGLEGKLVVATGLLLDGADEGVLVAGSVDAVNLDEMGVAAASDDADEGVVVSAETLLASLVEGLCVGLGLGRVDRSRRRRDTRDKSIESALVVAAGLALDGLEEVLLVDALVSLGSSRDVEREAGKKDDELVVVSASTVHCVVEAAGHALATRKHKLLEEVTVAATSVAVDVRQHACLELVGIGSRNKNTLLVRHLSDGSDEGRVVSAHALDGLVDGLGLSVSVESRTNARHYVLTDRKR